MVKGLKRGSEDLGKEEKEVQEVNPGEDRRGGHGMRQEEKGADRRREERREQREWEESWHSFMS